MEVARLSVDDVFSRLAEHLPGYEHRSQQLDFARLVYRSIDNGKPGIFEAGTGTGKSLAALIAAAVSGKRTVISSATISLQEQYIHKDIPTLQAILPFQVKAALLKGRGNYLGLRRYEEHLAQQEVDERLVSWAENTEAGDVAELDFMPSADTWLEINSDADDCMRTRCRHFSDCFYFQARRAAETADILVVNHALLLADAVSGGNVLPPHDVLIVDEAHQLPEIATRAFSSTMSNRGVSVFASRALKNISAPAYLVHNMEEAAQEFFARLSRVSTQARSRLRAAPEGASELLGAIIALRQWLASQSFEHLLDVEDQREKARLKAKALSTTAENYMRCLELLLTQDQEWVFFVERQDGKGRIELVAAPLAVDDFIRDHIFDSERLTTSVWMSATLATAGEDPFRYFKQQIGAPRSVIQKKISSPFDYERQAVLYLPPALPDPNTREFVAAACQEIERLLLISDGRAFVLFTSYSAMNAAHDLLKDRLPFECRRQGDMPRKKLLDWFRMTPHAVLFATASFWEGVSVDGDQLSCVIIDRIPFQSPDDPIYEARCEALKEDPDRNWFSDLALPHAIMRLKQGVGRLIRTRSDRGVVAILDPRMTQKRYGATIIESLPPMGIVQRLTSVHTMDDLLEPV